MKALVFAAVALAGCAAPLPQMPPAGQSAEAAAPSITPGMSLTYVARDGYTGLPRGEIEYRAADARDDVIEVSVRHDGRSWTERYTRDWNWRERPMTNLRSFRYDPPYPALPFPLFAGKTWHTDVQATDPATGRVNRVRVDGKVLGWDRVRVPAGEFDALKVRRYVYAGNAAFFRTEERIQEFDWYAPQAGCRRAQRSALGAHRHQQELQGPVQHRPRRLGREGARRPRELEPFRAHRSRAVGRHRPSKTGMRAALPSP